MPAIFAALLLLARACAQESPAQFPLLSAIDESGGLHSLGSSSSSSSVDPEAALESSSDATKLPDLKVPRDIGAIELRRTPQHFDWVDATQQSFYFLAMQHGFRMIQNKTRRNMGGKFFSDWFNAADGLDDWGDGDGALTNYVGHPMQGAITGWLQIQNDPKGIVQEFANTRSYWGSRFRAGSWSLLYSTQFELGPVSEASIGQVGYADKKRGQAGAVDLVMTPAAGMGLIIGEDAIDKYWIKKLESNTDSIPMRRFWRVALNPDRSLANLLRLKVPWHRDTRSLHHDILLSTDGLKDGTPAK